MGTFRVNIEIGDPQGQSYESIEALVDTGATHTLLPRNLLIELGVKPIERVSFQLADERIGAAHVLQDLAIDDFSRKRMAATETELREERAAIADLL